MRTIRAAIGFGQTGRAPSLIAVTSAIPGEGKTSLVMALGHVAALAGSKVLVIDCDLRRRAMSQALKPDAEHGLVEVLNGQLSVQQAIFNDARSGLDCLPLCQSVFTPRDLFGSKAFETLLDQLRQTYDLVIIDTPPVHALADTCAIASRVDHVLMVTLWQQSPVGVIKQALTALRACQANMLGLVLNQVDLNAQARYGDDGPGYDPRQYLAYYAD